YAVLTIQDGEDGSIYDVSVSCEVIYTSPVTAELLDGNVGYIIISNFREGAGSQAIEAVEELIAQGAESLIFDVRSNPGGQVSEMVELLDYLLPEGDLFIRADKNGRENVETSDADCVELPMAVIVNADSYSAAEFFAAALRDYDWATIVGEATTGKGRSQVTIALADGSAVHISKYTYLTPSRIDLYEAGGLIPDVEIDLTEEELLLYQTGWLEPEDDPQVQAAIDALSA
ncbi:MAG: S41 family peptidase, partial [Oscillospiraceae bacterium]|nr:S41 family peptidase [Oscillospiraceae bacterium]